VLTTFYHVAPGSVGYYLIAFALGNFLGPLLLDKLFDVVGRRLMIAGTYLVSGVMLAITARLFDTGVLTADTQTLSWAVIFFFFFFASAGASSAYLTVSEVFPMETRALAIAFFYAVGTGVGGIVGPALFGNLIASKNPGHVATGYVVGASLMFAAGLVELAIGVDAEKKSLEDLAPPLSAVEPTGEGAVRTGAPSSLARQTGPYPLPRTRTARSAWAPLPQASTYPRQNPYLAAEVDILVEALERLGPQPSIVLAHAVQARYWGPGRFREAVRSGIASGRIRRVGRNRLAAGTTLWASPPRSTASGHVD